MALTRLVTLLLLFSTSVFAYRMVGYWSLASGWEGQEGCAPILKPDRIPAELYTHIIYSFIHITNDSTIAEPDSDQLTYINGIQQLKEKNSHLKTMVSVGGWAMNMSLYSMAVSTSSSRAKLVQSSMTFLRKYCFDGIDFDWEYPNDPTRGGNAQDPANFALFMQQMRDAINAESIPSGKSRIQMSLALPGGPYHGVNYDMNSIIKNVDFANIMAYNLHGPWEPVVYCSANYYDGTPADSPYHGYSINDATQYFLNQGGNKLPSEKFNLGMTFAGVAFNLADAENSTPGSAAIGEGAGGPCTKEAGYMSYFEIENLLATQSSITPQYDSVGYCKYFVYGNGTTSQWIGYDDPDTLAAKVGQVKSAGLGGISVWAMYAESANGPELETAINKALGDVSDNTESESQSSGTKLSISSFLILTTLTYIALL